MLYNFYPTRTKQIVSTIKPAIHKILIMLVIALAVSISLGYAAEKSSNDLSPTVDSSSPTGFYIPINLEDCYKELQKMLSPEALKEFKEKDEKDIILYHRGLGRWLRNNWGLWGRSRLSRYFNTLGIFHPDDMSAIIITSFWRELNCKPIYLETQIKFYIDYWESQKK